MTKEGYKQIFVSIDTYNLLKSKPSEQQISRLMLIFDALRQAERRTLNPTAVGSNPSQPVSTVVDFSNNRSLKTKGPCPVLEFPGCMVERV